MLPSNCFWRSPAALTSLGRNGGGGPPPFGDGNFGLVLGPCHRLDGFNGATAFRRWKPVAPTLRRKTFGASMEPPPFGDGNQVPHRCRAEVGRASMEPPPFGDGNPSAGATLVSISYSLQWSHRLSAMETRDWRAGNPGGTQASMEPPPFGDGNMWKTAPVAVLRWVLQWSHRLSAMETCRAGGVGSDGPVASMEPPPFGDGNWPLANAPRGS